MKWIENRKLCKKIVGEKEIIRMKNSIHRISNRLNVIAECTIFRFVPQHQDYSQLIKQDKKGYSLNEIQFILKKE